MELKEFIKQTLTQIAQGVKESQDELVSLGAIVAPDLTSKKEGSYSIRTDSWGAQQITEIDFKVALTVNEKDGSQGGLGVMTGFLKVGGKIDSETSNQSVNSIEFTIPMVLPPADVVDILRKKRLAGNG